MKSLIIGSIAGILCTASFLPQAIKIYKTKNARDISLSAFATLGLGVFCWLIYGIVIMEFPIIIANAITLILVFLIVIMKRKYG
ncbi:MAG: SemiSWEET transporter [Candidatus Omnitrophota bacterium]